MAVSGGRDAGAAALDGGPHGCFPGRHHCDEGGSPPGCVGIGWGSGG